MRRALAALLASGGLLSCIAFVEAPTDEPELEPCGVNDQCPAGYQCGYFAAPIVVNREQVNPCVPSRCMQGAICEPGCNCGCDGCAADEYCDVQHSGAEARAAGDACVPTTCFNVNGNEFQCGGVDVGNETVHCLPCGGI
jgi:hypothetical protein